MAYFGSSSSQSSVLKLEPRTIFLVIWVLLCAIVLAVILRGREDTTTPTSAPALASSVSLPLKETKPSGQPMPVLLDVFVAKSDIPAGQKLTIDLFTPEKRSVQGFEERVVSDAAILESGYAATAIEPRAILLKESVSSVVPVNAVAARIPDGYRAVTIKVDTESGVEGWVRAGARVDVIWISTLRGKQVVSTIVEDVEILSAERSTEAQSDNTSAIPGHVTILVSAKDAQRVQLAKSSGILSLNLRGQTGQKKDMASEASTLTLDGLLSKDGEQHSIDTSGWITMNGKSYQVMANGKLKEVEGKNLAQDIYIQDAKK